jgi:hypothetical protein
VACLVIAGAGIAVGFWLHPAFAVVAALFAWLLYATVVGRARCRACGRFLAQEPGRFVRLQRYTVPEHCPHCGASVP